MATQTPGVCHEHPDGARVCLREVRFGLLKHRLDPGTGEPRIRQGVAPDRIVSVTDPEMRHGRKSRSGRFNGHKLHLIEEESTEIVLAVDVGAGNGSDGDHAAPLVEQAKEAGVKIAELVGDMAYGDGDTRAEVEAAGATVVAKVPPAPNTGFFAKTDFTIDPDAPSATCPAGATTTDARPTRDRQGRPTAYLVFDENVCAVCPFRSRCVKGRGGRTITLNVHEARLIEARAEFERPAVKRKLRRCAVVERKVDHLHDLGTKKARLPRPAKDQAASVPRRHGGQSHAPRCARGVPAQGGRPCCCLTTDRSHRSTRLANVGRSVPETIAHPKWGASRATCSRFQTGDSTQNIQRRARKPEQPPEA